MLRRLDRVGDIDKTRRDSLQCTTAHAIEGGVRSRAGSASGFGHFPIRHRQAGRYAGPKRKPPPSFNVVHPSCFLLILSALLPDLPGLRQPSTLTYSTSLTSSAGSLILSRRTSALAHAVSCFHSIGSVLRPPLLAPDLAPQSEVNAEPHSW